MRRESQLVLETNGSSIREGLLSSRGWPVEESSPPWPRISQSSRNSLKNYPTLFSEFLELCEILGHGGLDSSTGQPLEESRPSRIELPLVSNTSCVSLLIQGEPPFETRRGLRQGLHCYCIVRFDLDDPKILLVGLAYLMICGSYACWTLREPPYL